MFSWYIFSKQNCFWIGLSNKLAQPQKKIASTNSMQVPCDVNQFIQIQLSWLTVNCKNIDLKYMDEIFHPWHGLQLENLFRIVVSNESYKCTSEYFMLNLSKTDCDPIYIRQYVLMSGRHISKWDVMKLR